MRGRDTKDRIVTESFTLFAERGYHAVSVRDIAAAVGIKDASLYNHFPSKQAIFTAVLEGQLERMRTVFEQHGVMYAPTDDPQGYAGVFESTEQRVLAGYRFFFEDDDMIRLRRLLTVSQFHDEGAAEAFRTIFIERPCAIQRSIFEHLMALGDFNRDDAAALAREFHGPVLLLLLEGKTWSEAEPLIGNHLRRFAAMHRVRPAEADASRRGSRTVKEEGCS